MYFLHEALYRHSVPASERQYDGYRRDSERSRPEELYLEDNDGMNCLELAIESDVDIKIIKAMQRACRDTWREMEKDTKSC